MATDKTITTLHKLKEMVFPTKCPTCGWSTKQGHECARMFETLLKIEGVFSMQFMSMRENVPPEAIDINMQARDRNMKVQELLREWRETL